LEGTSARIRISTTPAWVGSALSAAAASAIVKNGNAIPSLRPLSTFRLWRISWGARGFEIVARPSAASVGARITATRRASQTPSPGSTPVATSQPRSIVRGSPIARSRIGPEIGVVDSRRETSA